MLLVALGACNGFPSISGPPTRYYDKEEEGLLFQAVIPALDEMAMGRQKTVGLNFGMVSRNIERIFSGKSIAEILDYWKLQGVECSQVSGAGGAVIICRVEHRWREAYPGGGARCLDPNGDSSKTYGPPCKASLRLFHKFYTIEGSVKVLTSTRFKDIS
ncbi:hypothetical protein [Bordetella ansorpii]|uniref:hypothetical protein n=1 Tax=Bordetella ansorpii TaxID=288768 RepID=UPI0012E7AE9D|nr:hypothetical protein [Bordetella ansorpii]